MNVFVSYSHEQGEWVRNELVPVLRASGTKPLVDWERFRAGEALVGQMDGMQDGADRHVLVITRDYLSSPYCLHEMDRAISLDCDFAAGIVIPVKLDDAKLPRRIQKPNPVYVDFNQSREARQWRLLIDQVGGKLMVDAPTWLSVRDQVVRHLRRKESVNIVCNKSIDWHSIHAIVDNIKLEYINELAYVDLTQGTTVTRRGLVRQIVSSFGSGADIPKEPNDIIEMSRFFDHQDESSYLAITNFELVFSREKLDKRYGTLDFIAALYYLTMHARKLILLVQSSQPFTALISHYPLYKPDLKTVELK